MGKWENEVHRKKLFARKHGSVGKVASVVGGSSVGKVEDPFASARVFVENVSVAPDVESKTKIFTEKSFERFSEYVCGICKHLVFRRECNTRVCDKGFALTKEYCSSWVDDTLNIRIKMPDGCFMYLSME